MITCDLGYKATNNVIKSLPYINALRDNEQLKHHTYTYYQTHI